MLRKCASDFGVLNSEAGNGGLIAIDAKGNATWTFNSSGMFRGAAGIVDGSSVLNISQKYLVTLFVRHNSK